MGKVTCMEALDFLNQLPESPRLILTDPPYGIKYKTNMPGSKQWNKSGTLAAECNGGIGKFPVMMNDDNSIDFDRVFKACFDVLQEDGYLCVCTGWKALPTWVTSIKLAGFTLLTPIYWNKKCANGGDLNDPIISVVETIIRASKGIPKVYPVYDEAGVLTRHVTNLWSYGRTPKSEYCGHPTQKPIYLGEQLVRMSTTEQELVVDPFCGSGTFLLASAGLSRRWHGNDLDPKYAEMANQRLGTMAVNSSG